MEDLVTVTKKLGRPKNDVQFNSAARQRMTRSKAHFAFESESDIEKSKKIADDMSTSNLISLLAKLMGGKRRMAVEIVCAELVKRVNNK